MKKCTHPLFQAAAVVTAALQIGSTAPVYASVAAAAPVISPAGLPAVSAPAAAAPQPAPVQVRHTRADFQAPSGRVTISENPSNDEIYRLRLFDEPLVPVSGTTTVAENRALGGALRAWMQRPDPEDHSALEGFLQARPASPWRVALLTNLGIVYSFTGYFTKALTAWEQAWSGGKNQRGPSASAITDRALAELARLNARLGRADRLQALFEESAGRNIRGSATELVAGAKQGLHLMRTRPDQAFPCGPMALEQILKFARPEYRSDARLREFATTIQGSSLTQIRDLAEAVGLPMQMAKRDADVEIPLPSVVHWKAGHFAALVESRDGAYHVEDPTFGNDFWVSRRALLAETTGYFVLPPGSLAPGWRSVQRDEGSGVWGKGNSSTSDPAYTTEEDDKQPNCRECPKQGMAGYSVHSMLVSLNVQDTPVGYAPPRGPAINFRVTYNQREAFHPTTFSYSNLGPKWTFDWISYVEDNPGGTLSQAVTVYRRSGGQESFDSYDSGTATYAPTLRSRATLARTSASLTPISYERRMSDGSVEVFAEAMPGTPRKVLLTEITDAQGNAITLSYDTSYRLVSITDVIGQVTTLSYELSYPNDLLITKVTDPFGRYATFEYNTLGQLESITDVIGMSSVFEYGSGDFIDSLTTPYGTTTFTSGESGRDRWLEILDPLGGKERIEYKDTFAPIPTSESAVPSVMTVYNSLLDHYNTFFWDKRATALYPKNYSKAKVTRWLTAGAGKVVGIKDSEKSALEGRVWYAYSGSSGWPNMGSSAAPTTVGRVLDDATTQLYQYDYNSLGHVTRFTDPVGRETVYEYDSGGIDLIAIMQKNGASYDTLETRAYKQTSGSGCSSGPEHVACQIADAAGQLTTYTYNTNGTLASVVTAPRSGLSATNRTTTYSYVPNGTNGEGRIQTITAPLSATASYNYDGTGRVLTVTNTDGDALTYSYDALDRVTKVTSPDGTYEEVAYNRLDVDKRRDRAGRWTHMFYDALRHVVGIRDPLGRSFTQTWCNCGSLDKVTDPSGNSTTWERDIQGRKTREIRADGKDNVFVYDNTTSRQREVRDYMMPRQITGYQYFADDSLKKITYTNEIKPTADVEFTYDPVYSRIATTIDGVGTTTYTYHAVGTLGALQLAATDGPLANDTVSLSYDELMRPWKREVNGSANSVTWVFDALGRVISETNALGVFSAAYSGATSRVSNTMYPNGQTVEYDYFAAAGDHRVKQIHNKLSGGTTLSKFDYTYDPAGNTKTWSQQRDSGTPQVMVYSYDDADQLSTAVRSPADATLVDRFAYTYNGSGNRTAEQLDDAVMQSSYDNRNRLVQQSPGGLLRFQGSTSEAASVTVDGTAAAVSGTNVFDARTEVGGSGNTDVTVAATDYSGNVQTEMYRISQSGSSKSYTYDANGNMTSDGVRAFEWDAQNRLVLIRSGANCVGSGTSCSEFTYNGDSHPVRILEKIDGTAISDKKYIWAALSLVEERNASDNTVTKRFFSGGVEADGTTDYLYTKDHLQSVVEMTNSSGALQARYDYDPWGRSTKLAGSGDAFSGFTGHMRHSSGLAVTAFRAYDAAPGRWVNEDPIGVLGEDWNLYRYVGNAPVSRSDTLGLVGPNQVPQRMHTEPPPPLPPGPPPNSGAWWCKVALSNMAARGITTTKIPWLHHDYLCVAIDGKMTCGSTTPKGGVYPGPGVPTNEPYSEERCSPIPTGDCHSRCIRRKIVDPNRPWFALGSSGTDCQQWSDEALSDCWSKCLWQAMRSNR